MNEQCFPPVVHEWTIRLAEVAADVALIIHSMKPWKQYMEMILKTKKGQARLSPTNASCSAYKSILL